VQQAGQPVSSFDPGDDMIVEHAAGLAVGQIRQARHQRERQQQRAELGKSNRIDHRKKQLCLNPFECEQGQIGGDDDQGREEDRACNLMSRAASVLFGEPFIRL
jgi:hypothetical protein